MMRRLEEIAMADEDEIIEDVEEDKDEEDIHNKSKKLKMKSNI